MIEDKDYKFVENPGALLYSVEILTGVYTGIIYTYGKVSIKETSGNAVLSFTYKIEKNDNDINTDSKKFNNYIGDILTEIIEKGNVRENPNSNITKNNKCQRKSK